MSGPYQGSDPSTSPGPPSRPRHRPRTQTLPTTRVSSLLLSYPSSGPLSTTRSSSGSGALGRPVSGESREDRSSVSCPGGRPRRSGSQSTHPISHPSPLVSVYREEEVEGISGWVLRSHVHRWERLPNSSQTTASSRSLLGVSREPPGEERDPEKDTQGWERREDETGGVREKGET